MAIVYKLLADGGFVAGDTETRHTSYAYPTSEHAIIARRIPERVAADMVKSANHFAASFTRNVMLDAYDARMWAKLETV